MNAYWSINECLKATNIYTLYKNKHFINTLIVQKNVQNYCPPMKLYEEYNYWTQQYMDLRMRLVDRIVVFIVSNVYSYE